MSTSLETTWFHHDLQEYVLRNNLLALLVSVGCFITQGITLNRCSLLASRQDNVQSVTLSMMSSEVQTQPAALRDLTAVLNVLALIDEDFVTFNHACRELNIKPIYKPFWEPHAHLNIFLSITPDVLHQLYQGMLKHLLIWIWACCSEAEIDACCRRLPPNHNMYSICLFMKGITLLS